MLAVKVGRLEDLGYPPAPSPPRRASRAAYGYEYEYGNFLRAAVRCAWNPPRNLAYAPRNLAYAHANLLGCIYVCFGCSSLFLAG